MATDVTEFKVPGEKKKLYLRFYAEERIQERYDYKTPLEVRTEALAAVDPMKYPIPENKRIKKYKEKWCA